jgi:hypothetical protein
LRHQSQRHRMHWSYLTSREWFTLPPCPRSGRFTRWSEGVALATALWGAHCGQSARWVLRGGTSPRSHAHSVRALARKGQPTARLRNGLPLRGSSLPTSPIRRPTMRISAVMATRAITGRTACKWSSPWW